MTTPQTTTVIPPPVCGDGPSRSRAPTPAASASATHPTGGRSGARHRAHATPALGAGATSADDAPPCDVWVPAMGVEGHTTRVYGVWDPARGMVVDALSPDDGAPSDERAPFAAPSSQTYGVWAPGRGLADAPSDDGARPRDLRGRGSLPAHAARSSESAIAATTPRWRYVPMASSRRGRTRSLAHEPRVDGPCSTAGCPCSPAAPSAEAAVRRSRPGAGPYVDDFAPVATSPRIPRHFPHSSPMELQLTALAMRFAALPTAITAPLLREFGIYGLYAALARSISHPAQGGIYAELELDGDLPDLIDATPLDPPDITWSTWLADEAWWLLGSGTYLSVAA